MTEEEAYQILGIRPSTSPEEIARAHRSLIKKLRPDQGGSTFSQLRSTKQRKYCFAGIAEAVQSSKFVKKRPRRERQILLTTPLDCDRLEISLSQRISAPQCLAEPATCPVKRGAHQQRDDARLVRAAIGPLRLRIVSTVSR